YSLPIQSLSVSRPPPALLLCLSLRRLSFAKQGQAEDYLMPHQRSCRLSICPVLQWLPVAVRARDCFRLANRTAQRKAASQQSESPGDCRATELSLFDSTRSFVPITAGLD